MKKDKTSIIIIIILIALAIIGYFVFGGGPESNYDKLKTLVVETTSGRKVQTEYTLIEGNKFYVKVPTEFNEMGFDNKKARYPLNTPARVYASDDQQVFVTLDLTKEKVNNEEIKNYQNKKVEYYKENATVQTAESFETDGHTVATIEYTEKDMYYNVAYFSYSGNLGIITFESSMDVIGEWNPVSKFVIDSIYFD